MNGDLIRHFFIFFCLCGAIAWCVMFYCAARINMEYRRALDAGEADDVPRGGRGIPFIVLFTDRFPAIRKERRLFAKALCAFLACLAAALIVGTVFGPNW